MIFWIYLIGLCTTLSSLKSELSVENANLYPETLLIYEKETIFETHINFLRILEKNSNVKYSKPIASLNIKKYGEYIYDNIVIMISKSRTIGGLAIDALTDYVNEGKNLIIILERDNSEVIKKLVQKFGFKVATNGISSFADNFNNNGGKNYKIVKVAATNLARLSSVYDNMNIKDKNIMYDGCVIKCHGNDDLIFPLLNAPYTSYVNQKEGLSSNYPRSIGTSSLIAALQTRNNARVTLIGSSNMLSDKFNILSQQTNLNVARNVISWGFKQKGVLQLVNPTHYIQSKDKSHPQYTISQPIYYSIDAYQFNIEKSPKWEPFITNQFQLEFIRIDPFYRLNLNSSQTHIGRYEASFQLPDVFGIFKFSVIHNIPGYTYVDQIVTTSIAPLRHDQADRFVIAAYPYYMNAFVVMIMTWILVIVIMSSKKLKVKVQ
ncbi:Oligosaccharyl transferase subunit [Intoshia linei]|uniref:Dolichyl-diphosphooligosaccharide--protein glycosyltransferase 48 kDa subunit n=1 Tax=Intoshia linei TaxID=1819745 RepID=A0A177BBM8_9BILA|nr:Oligosaccharyl transferase subunit [Intoshia linei]